VDPAPFIRGCAWPSAPWAPYPRCDPRDFTRLPVDTWGTAQIPAGVRLELVGSERVSSVDVRYRCATDELGYRGDGAGRTFTLWQDGEKVSEAKAEVGDGVARLELRPGGAPAAVYLPEGMKPTITGLAGMGGTIAPAPVQPRWIAYGDSLAEGWVASEPALAWPAIAGRRHGLDVVNLGYAGAARGELASAEQIAALDSPAVISITHGTNCWTRTPHSAAQMRANTDAFLAVVREGHPDTPMVVCSPVVRPDAEMTPNRLGATLVDLRAAMEASAQASIDAGDTLLTLVSGNGVLTADQLPDGIHPGDEGHAVLAEVFGAAVARAASF